MNHSYTRSPIIVDTAPPPLPSLGPLKPTVVYMNNSTSSVAQALNAAADAVNATVRNATRGVTAAANSTMRGANRGAAATVAAAPRSTTTSTTKATSIPWSEEFNKMTTTSVSDRASKLSLLHLLAWFLLFATLTMTTVVLLNWCLRSRQSAAEANEAEEAEEEMSAKSLVLPSSSTTQGTLAEGPNSASSSSSRLLASRGNLARQQFLESRKISGSNTKNYGGTGTT